MHTRRAQYGFTLIEAVVASALFAAAIAAGVGMYLSIIRAQNETTASRRASEDGRYIMELISREIRTGHIDYAAYGSVPGNCPGGLAGLTGNNGSLCIDVLHVIGENDPAGQRVVIIQPNGTDNLQMTVNGSAATTLNSTPNVRVSNVHFIIDPGKNPFASFPATPDVNSTCATIPAEIQRQPRVTILMDVTGLAQAGTAETLHLQTTVTTKEYPCF